MNIDASTGILIAIASILVGFAIWPRSREAVIRFIDGIVEALDEYEKQRREG
jgi:hypothetical protein